MDIEPLFDASEVAARVSALADRIAHDYADAPLCLVCIVEGARRFVDDLEARLRERGVVPERLDVRVRRTDGSDLGPVMIDAFDADTLADRDVLLCDDLADEGETLEALHELVAMGEPRSVRIAVVVDKRERRSAPVALDYVGFVVERGWVVGYGMDLDGDYRELDWIGVLADHRF